MKNHLRIKKFENEKSPSHKKFENEKSPSHKTFENEISHNYISIILKGFHNLLQ